MRIVTYGIVGAALIFATGAVHAQGTLAGRQQVVLAGKAATLAVDVAGGSIVDFHLSGGMNPLTWNYPEKPDLKPRMMGHFVCYDRWGQPSQAELANGMPFHGEAATVAWTIDRQPSTEMGAISAVVSCRLPIAGMGLTRTLTMHENSSVVHVTDVAKNLNALGRVYNILQHATIAPPFLDETTLVDANVHDGLMQEAPFDGPVIYWPQIAYRGKLVDFRHLTDDPNPNVVSYVFADGEEWGWTTACTPGRGLLVGYLWNLEDYPWLSFWQHVADGKPAARGLEFGTTGLHRPFADILAQNELHGTRLFEYMDAGGTTTKSFYMFLAKVPADYAGTGTVRLEGGNIVIAEGEGGKDRTITLNLK